MMVQKSSKQFELFRTLQFKEAILTFSEYLKMLYELFGNKQGRANFITTFFEQVTDFDDAEDCDSDSIIDKSSNHLEKIYNGTKPLSKKDATHINGHINNLKFEKYILDFNEDTSATLSTKLSSIGYENNGSDSDIVAKCIALLRDILSEIINPKTEDPNIKDGSTKTNTQHFGKAIIVNQNAKNIYNIEHVDNIN